MSRPVIHPREILIEELAELGVTPTELSRQINVPPNRVTQIIHGRRGITGDIAVRVGHWFGTSAQFWLNLQSAYDTALPRSRAWRPGDSRGRSRGRESCRGSFFGDIFLTEAPDVPILFLRWIEARPSADGQPLPSCAANLTTRLEKTGRYCLKTGKNKGWRRSAYASSNPSA